VEWAQYMRNTTSKVDVLLFEINNKMNEPQQWFIAVYHPRDHLNATIDKIVKEYKNVVNKSKDSKN